MNKKLLFTAVILLALLLEITSTQAQTLEMSQNASAENFHETPLMKAAYADDLANIQKLLEGKIDVNAQNDLGLTALYYAAGATPLGKVRNDKTSYETVKLLLDHGANPNLSGNKTGITPLMAAVQNNLPETAKLLIDRGAATDANGTYGTTALMDALDGHKWKIANLLLDKKAKINGPADVNGYDALIHAVSDIYPLSTIPSVEKVFPQGVPDDAADTAEGTKIVERLLDDGAKTDHFNNLGQTAFLIAAMGCRSSLVALLLKHGVDVNQKDKTAEDTALIDAVRCKDASMIKMLLEHHADQNVKDKFGKSALDFAEALDAKDIVQIF